MKRLRKVSLTVFAFLIAVAHVSGCSTGRPSGDSHDAPSAFKVVIPEGLTAKQISQRIESATRGRITGEEFLKAADPAKFDFWFLKDARGTSEGFLFPKTYNIPLDATPRGVVRMLLSQFEKEVTGLEWERARVLGLTPYQVVILASLIEKEVRVPEERALVASVMYNRLARGMRLEIDATVQYALGEWKPSLSYEDLQVDSPYNTYRIKGLPPTPICNPGFECLRAALYPAQTDYLYYVLTDPAAGRHSFTSDYRQFLIWKEESNRRPPP